MKQKSDFARPKNNAICLGAILFTIFILVGCGTPPIVATPTPTKTPLGGQASAESAATTPVSDGADTATSAETPTATLASITVASAQATDSPQAPNPTATTAAATAIPATAVPATVVPTVALPTSTTVVLPTQVPRPENVAPYTGLAVSDPAALTRQPIMVCINNDTKGRSEHRGLTQADLVYEYLMDGYVTTRLTAIYHSQESDHIGPVRSARFPNVWMSEMYNGLLACSGGSDAIRYILRNEVTFYYLDGDLDDPGSNVYFFNENDTVTGRLDYRTRLRTSTAGVRKWAENKGYLSTWNRPGFTYSQERPNRPSVPSEQINITYPGGNSVRWVYSASSGGYQRYQGGVQQIDLANGQPVIAQNVIVMTTLHEVTDVIEDSLGTKGIDVKLYGINEVLVFRDGQVYAGTWQADAATPPRWNGFDGTPIPLKPGQSWVQAIRDSSEISY